MRSILILLAAVAAPAAAIAAGPTTFTVVMTPAVEVPGPGDAKASGTATLAFDSTKNQLCYTLTAAGGDTPNAAHVHKGATGVAGPPVVMLKAPATGSITECTAVAPDVITAILANPAGYYVNVHSAAFPKGAIRGQLK